METFAELADKSEWKELFEEHQQHFLNAAIEGVSVARFEPQWYGDEFVPGNTSLFAQGALEIFTLRRGDELKELSTLLDFAMRVAYRGQRKTIDEQVIALS